MATVTHTFVSAIADSPTAAAAGEVLPSHWNAAHTVSVSASDVGLGSVTNDAQTKAAIVPNTAPAAGEVLVGNAGGTAYAKQAISGDATLASTGALTIGNSKITLAKIANASASSKLLGSGASGSGAAYAELTLGTNLSMTGTTLNATGGGGTPAGSGTELQYNNAGAFGAMSGTAWDDTNRAETRTGATVTTSNPVQSFTQTWNAGAVTFTGWKLNVTSTASAAASLLMDLQVAGASQFSVRKDGFISTQAAASIGGALAIFGTLNANGWNSIGGSNGAGVGLAPLSMVGWVAAGGNAGASTGDTALARNAAGIVEINNGSAGTFRDLIARNVRTNATTVASLTAAATAGAGARSFVTDATATTFLSTVAGGGANKVPVVSDGTNWLIG